MAEYIKREAAIAALTEFCYEQTVSKYLSVDDCLVARGAIERAIKVLESLPAADVAPVKRGRWEEADWFEPDCHSFGTIRTPKAALRCSNCKHCFKKELLWKDNYCPNCGARMDEEAQNER